jgi:arginine/lysine/histidine/glutamine transport system substrate-binding/permease protein
MASWPRLSMQRRRGVWRWLLLGLIGFATVALQSGLVAASQPVWKVGTDPSSPPFEFRNSLTGAISGFDVELIDAIGKESGHAIKRVPLPFHGLVPALQSRSVDLAISAITITPERAKAIDFSRPYFKAGQAIVVRENETSITSLDELKGRRIAVQIGTTGAELASRVAGAKVSSFDSTPIALQELANCNADAVLSDLPVILYAIDQAGLSRLRVSGEPLTNEVYGIALPTKSPLLGVVNQSLNSLIKSGRYAEIYRKWFGTDPPTLPDQAPGLSRSPSPLAGLDLGILCTNLLKGAGITLMLTAFSFSFGLIGGVLLALLLQLQWPPARWICRIYIDFFRGTPMLVQLFLIYFGLPALLQSLELPFTIDRLVAAVAALSLNVAAYLAETLRSGIESIDRGQWEAADALGFSPVERMRFVIAPQAIRRVLPPLANEFVTLIKDTSLAAVIGFEELFRQGQLMVATTYRAFEIYTAVALVYLIMTTLAAFAFRRIEARMSVPI